MREVFVDAINVQKGARLAEAVISRVAFAYQLMSRRKSSSRLRSASDSSLARALVPV